MVRSSWLLTVHNVVEGEGGEATLDEDATQVSRHECRSS